MKPAQKQTVTILFIGALLYVNWVLFSPYFMGSSKVTVRQEASGDSSTVREENGQQIIHIVAKQGYQPRLIAAKANKPTVLEFETNGYDCSAALKIPALKVQQYLSATEPTRIQVPPQQPGTTLTGLCSMGMYKFDIKFG